MCAHILFPKIDEYIPSFSNYWLKDFLRNELNYRGIVFSDDLTMLGAGNDLFIGVDTTGSGDEGVIENTTGQKIRFKVKSSGGVTTERFHIQAVGLIPTQTATYDIGDINYKSFGKVFSQHKELRKIKKDENPGWRIAKPNAEPINGAVQGVATITAKKPVPKEFI